jgi:hypothetical protein
LNGGIGFDDIPKLIIQSKTGINAVMQPVFGIIRIGEIPDAVDIIPPGTKIVHVKQCF